MASFRALKLVDVGNGTGELREFADGDAQTLAGALNEAAAAIIPSAATVNIGAAAANTVYITGAIAITAFDVADDGVTRRVVFNGALTLTHNSTSLVLPGAASIAVEAGDSAFFVSMGSGKWRCMFYQRASGRALVGSSVIGGIYETTVAWTAGGAITVTHNLGVVPKLVVFELVAKVAFGGLSIGQTEMIVSEGFGSANIYNCSARALTTTQLIVNVANLGLATSNGGGATGWTAAQGDLKIRVLA